MTALIIGLVLGGLAIVGLIVGLFLAYRNNKKRVDRAIEDAKKVAEDVKDGIEDQR